MTELKPCPFCGYKLEWGDGNSKEPYCTDEGEEIYTISCPDCGCGVAPGSTLEEVISNWNKRVTEQELKDEIARYIKELRKQIESNGCFTDIEYNLRRIEQLSSQ